MAAPLNRSTMSAPYCVPDRCRRTCACDLREPLVSACQSPSSIRNRRSKICSMPCSSRAPSACALDRRGRLGGESSGRLDALGSVSGSGRRLRVAIDFDELSIRRGISARDSPDAGRQPREFGRPFGEFRRKWQPPCA